MRLMGQLMEMGALRTKANSPCLAIKGHQTIIALRIYCRGGLCFLRTKLLTLSLPLHSNKLLNSLRLHFIQAQKSRKRTTLNQKPAFPPIIWGFFMLPWYAYKLPFARSFAAREQRASWQEGFWLGSEQVARGESWYGGVINMHCTLNLFSRPLRQL